MDRRTQDAVDRALSDLIVDLALQGDLGDEIDTIANALHIWRAHQRDAKLADKPRKRRRLSTPEEAQEAFREAPQAETMVAFPHEPWCASLKFERGQGGPYPCDCRDDNPGVSARIGPFVGNAPSPPEFPADLAIPPDLDRRGKK